MPIKAVVILNSDRWWSERGECPLLWDSCYSTSQHNTAGAL